MQPPHLLLQPNLMHGPVSVSVRHWHLLQVIAHRHPTRLRGRIHMARGQHLLQLLHRHAKVLRARGALVVPVHRAVLEQVLVAVVHGARADERVGFDARDAVLEHGLVARFGRALFVGGRRSDPDARGFFEAAAEERAFGDVLGARFGVVCTRVFAGDDVGVLPCPVLVAADACEVD